MCQVHYLETFYSYESFGGLVSLPLFHRHQQAVGLLKHFFPKPFHENRDDTVLKEQQKVIDSV